MGDLENYNDFFHDNELRDTSELCGPKEVMDLREYFESLHDRGVTVARAARAPHFCCRDAIGISWPPDRPLLDAAVTVEDAPPPNRDPEFNP